MKYREELEKLIEGTNNSKGGFEHGTQQNGVVMEGSEENGTVINRTVEDIRQSITNLPGLRVFFEAGDRILKENPDKQFGLISMDIDQFKTINEFLGRKTGDLLIAYISDLFCELEKSRPLSKATHARADCFSLLTMVDSVDELVEIVERLYTQITTYPLEMKVLPSFGIYFAFEKNVNTSFMKDCATIALKNIKGKFYAKYAIFDDNMRKNILLEKKIENDIREALKKKEIKLFIQPKVDMRTGRIIGGESLVRWEHNELGLVSPGDFIPVIEKDGYIIPVDYDIWEQTYRYLSKRKQKGQKLLPISINISRIHAYDDYMVDKLFSLSRIYDIDPQYVPMELTESAFAENKNDFYNCMKYLKEQGFILSMDDFGTGLSSLQMLTTQPLNEVKIDRSFITSLNDEKKVIVLKNIISMLKELNINFIIEGVETKEQMDMLLSLGCYNAQGFLFYKPMPIEEFDKLLESYY